MKKVLFAALAGVVVLAGCAKTEVAEVADNRAISFDNFVTNNVKSFIDEKTDLTKMYVYGGYATAPGIFVNQEVSFDGAKWTYTPVRYWKPDQTYHFAAYSNGNDKIDEANITFNGNHHLVINYTLADAANNDLVYAAGLEAGYQWAENMEPVHFTFHHILSKVRFSFSKAADLNGLDVEVRNITIKPNTVATFTGATLAGGQYDYSCWTGWATPGTVNFPVVTVPENVDGPASSEYRLFIPQDVTSLNVAFDVVHAQLTEQGTIDNENTEVIRHFEVTLSNVDGNRWNPGHVYTYNAEIKASNLDLEPIEFTVDDVTTWTDKTVDDIIGDTEGIIE